MKADKGENYTMPENKNEDFTFLLMSDLKRIFPYIRAFIIAFLFFLAICYAALYFLDIGYESFRGRIIASAIVSAAVSVVVTLIAFNLDIIKLNRIIPYGKYKSTRDTSHLDSD